MEYLLTWARRIFAQPKMKNYSRSHNGSATNKFYHFEVLCVCAFAVFIFRWQTSKPSPSLCGILRSSENTEASQIPTLLHKNNINQHQKCISLLTLEERERESWRNFLQLFWLVLGVKKGDKINEINLPSFGFYSLVKRCVWWITNWHLRWVSSLHFGLNWWLIDPAETSQDTLRLRGENHAQWHLSAISNHNS